MTEKGVIENYALAGAATAVVFYTEPIAAEDRDIFFHIHPGESILTELQPIFGF